MSELETRIIVKHPAMQCKPGWLPYWKCKKVPYKPSIRKVVRNIPGVREQRIVQATFHKNWFYDLL